MKKVIYWILALALLPGWGGPVQADDVVLSTTPSPDWERAACSKGYGGKAGIQSATIMSGGMERSYLLYVPEAYDGSADWPLIFDFHGSGSTPEVQRQVSGLDHLAEREHFLLVIPRAALLKARGINTWNIPYDPDGVDDVQFTRDMVARLEAEFCVDERAVYATGFSGGARMSSELACRASDIIAAVAPVAGLRFPDGDEGDCTSGRPMPILTFHSIDDPVNLYEVSAGSNPPPYWSYGVEEALKRWARKDDCESTVPAPKGEGLEGRTYQDCDASSTIIFYRFDTGGHTWPGSTYEFGGNIGTPVTSVNASETIVDFFKRYRLPAQ